MVRLAKKWQPFYVISLSLVSEQIVGAIIEVSLININLGKTENNCLEENKHFIFLFILVIYLSNAENTLSS